MFIEVGVGVGSGLAVGVAITYGFLLLRKKDARSQADSIVEESKRDATNRLKEVDLKVREQELASKAKVEKELSKVREDLHGRKQEIEKKKSQLENQSNDLRKQEKIVEQTQRRLTEKLSGSEKRRKELDKILDMQRQVLHQASGLDKDEATSKLLALLSNELQQERGSVILNHQKKIEQECDAVAQDILLTALHRFAASHTAESTTSTVDIPNDEMKGRIIGREGRNIRSFEKETGVDVIIDDTPGVVIVSGFDPVRREVARASLTKLITDGRIHPSRIEEVVKETQGEIEEYMRRKGIEAIQEVDTLGVQDRVVELLGRLHFRTSYSQNVLRHSVEVSFLSGLIAEMVGLDAALARRCGLLHDIGKAADHEMEGGHPKIGADILKRHGENEHVVHAAFGHHDEIITDYPYTMIVATADACSASRPGARRESLERYIKRMEELEAIAKEFKGVQQAFAIQAGREIRVIASSTDTTDEKAAAICRDIAAAFEVRLTYPGEIKVTVVREARFTELAK